MVTILRVMRLLFKTLVVCALAANVGAAPEPGVKKGSAVPPFSLRDQNGHTQSLESLRGPKGLMLVFVRSADW